jgi:hypothetical protein
MAKSSASRDRHEQRTAGVLRVPRNGGDSRNWWFGESPVATPFVQDPTKAGRGKVKGRGDDGGKWAGDGSNAQAMPFAWGEEG